MNLKHTLLANGAFGGMTASERRLGRFLRAEEGHPAPTPTPTPTPEPEPDAFADAFAEHAAEPAADGAGGDGGKPPAGDGAAPPAAGESDPAAPEAGAGAAPPAADSGAAPAAPAGGDPAPTPAPAGDAPAADGQPALSAEEVLNRLAGLIPQPAPAGGEPAPAAPAAEAQPVYTAEEEAILTEYEKNWPDVAKAEMLRRRAEYADIFKFVFTEVGNYIKPLQEQLGAIGNTLHMGELRAAVPDYSDSLEADVTKWIDTQPAYLQAPYKQVMQNGTSDEVADLIGRYRAASGAAAPAPTPAPAAPAAGGAPAPAAAPAVPAKTELSSAAKQAAESLAPVSGDRSAVPQGEDPGDFESAFARYAATGG